MTEQLAGSGAWSGAARRSVALSRPVVLALVRTPVGSSTHALETKKAPRGGLFLSGGEGGIDSLPLEAHPAGGLRPSVARLCRARIEPVGSSTHPSPVNTKGPARGPFVFTGGEGGIDSLAPRAHPSGGLRPSVARLCRARFEPRWVRPHTLSRQKKAPRGGLFLSGGEGGIRTHGRD